MAIGFFFIALPNADHTNFKKRAECRDFAMIKILFVSGHPQTFKGLKQKVEHNTLAYLSVWMVYESSYFHFVSCPVIASISPRLTPASLQLQAQVWYHEIVFCKYSGNLEKCDIYNKLMYCILILFQCSDNVSIILGCHNLKKKLVVLR